MNWLAEVWVRTWSRGGRSTALHSMQWMLGLSLTGLVFALREDAPNWLIVTLVCFVGLAVAVYLGAYLYLLIRNPDALRSERFTLEKMAIEKGVVGDHLVGTADPDQAKNVRRLAEGAVGIGGERS